MPIIKFHISKISTRKIEIKQWLSFEKERLIQKTIPSNWNNFNFEAVDQSIDFFCLKFLKTIFAQNLQ